MIQNGILPLNLLKWWSNEKILSSKAFKFKFSWYNDFDKYEFCNPPDEKYIHWKNYNNMTFYFGKWYTL